VARDIFPRARHDYRRAFHGLGNELRLSPFPPRSANEQAIPLRPPRVIRDASTGDKRADDLANWKPVDESFELHEFNMRLRRSMA
jgi:hypothetical protein